MSSSRNSAFRRRPRTSRGREIVESILSATTQLLQGTRYERVNTNLIAKRAGVSVGSLYQYFDSKESILAEIAWRHADHVLEAIGHEMSRVGALPIRDTVRSLARLLLEFHRSDGRDPPVTALVPPARVRDVTAARDDRIRELLTEYLASRTILSRDQSHRAALVVLGAIEGVIRASDRSPPDEPIGDPLVNDIVELVDGYLERLSQSAPRLSQIVYSG